MFFAIELLIPQHGGKFAIPWLSATRGVQYVSKKDIAQCNIIMLCDEIIKMVQCSSSRPRLRLSLSLASRLVNGVVKIYKRQVEITTEELQNFLCQVRAPLIDSSISLEGTPRVPVPRVRRRRRRDIVQLSDEPAALAAIPTNFVVEDFLEDLIPIDEAELARPSIYQVHPDRITLREEHPREEVGDMDGFGVLEDGEPPAFPGAPLQVAVHLPSTAEKRQATDAPGAPSKRRVIMQIPELEIPNKGEIEPISEVAPQYEIQVVPDTSNRPEVPVIHKIPETEEVPQLEAQTAEVPELEVTPRRRVPPKRRGKAPQWVAKTNINMRKGRAVNINRCLPTARERFDFDAIEDRIDVDIKQLTDQDQTQNLKNILYLFMEENQPQHEVDEVLAEYRRLSRNTDSLFRTSSLSLLQPRGRAAPESTPTPIPSTSAMPAALQPTVPLKPHQIIVHADVHVPAVADESMVLSEQIVEPPTPMGITKRLEIPDQTVKPLAESTGVSIPQIDLDKSIQPPDHTIETVVPPAAEAANIQATVVRNPTAAEIKRTLAKDRQKRIRDIVKNWNTEEQITIEDVCYKPVNRTNIALAFNDLLSLHKMGYVKLNNKPDSLELGTIEKGRRIIERE